MKSFNSFSSRASLVIVTLLVHFTTGQFQGGQDFGGQAHCPEFKCPNDDETPLPKSPMNYLKSPGCDSIGGGGINMFGHGGNNNIAELIAPCCDVFNACVQVCGVTKQYCTRNFDQCLDSKCKSISDADTKKKCDGEIQVKKLMVQISQCREFEEGQKNCRCVKKDSYEEEKAKLVRSFYAKFNSDNVEKADALAAKASDKHKLAGLIIKLLGKYPKAIKKVEDPKKKEMEDLMRNMKQAEAKKVTTSEDEVEENEEEDEKIEL